MKSSFPFFAFSLCGAPLLTNSGVKPRRSGRGYKPRKPGADFI